VRQLQQGFTTGEMGADRHFAWQQVSGLNVRFDQKQTFGPFIAMSALPPKADIAGQ
jgi:hypothetical protein